MSNSTFGRFRLSSGEPEEMIMRLSICPTPRLAVALVAACLATGAAGADERESPIQPSATWDVITPDIVGAAEVLDGSGLFTFEAPFRAHDAATVPVRIAAGPDAPRIRRMTLVVDENPAPVAAEFEFGPAMQPLDLEARVRVDAYTNVRAILETEDGRLYQVGRYVRASGGCSAPAAKDAAEAMAALGQMRVRWFDDAPAMTGVRREAQVMLRHPNYSGLQRDQVTHLFIPTHFVDRIEVHQGAELLFTLTGGISISEDPTFRFTYVENGTGGLSISATDTRGGAFEGSFPLAM
jgi:sulfur-oxidizing protein SoxY